MAFRWQMKFAAAATAIGLLGAGVATLATMPSTQMVVGESSSPLGQTSTLSSNSGSSSDANVMLDDKKKKKKKKKKQKQKKQQQRNNKKNERREHREDRRQQTQLPAPRQQPKVEVQRGPNSETTIHRGQTTRKTEGAETKITHDIRGATRTSVDGPHTTKPPESTRNGVPVKLKGPSAEVEIVKYGSDQANVRIGAYNLSSSAEYGDGNVSANASAGVYVVKAHVEKAFETPVGNLRVDANASVGADAAAKFSAGKDGVSVGVDAFVGVKADTSFSYGTDGVKAVVTAEAQAGLSFAADVGAQMTGGKIKLNWKFGAAVGLGGKLSGAAEIDPAKLVEEGKEVVDGIKDFGSAVVGSASKLFD